MMIQKRVKRKTKQYKKGKFVENRKTDITFEKSRYQEDPEVQQVYKKSS